MESRRTRTFGRDGSRRYSFENGAKGQRYYRSALFMGTLAFFAWAYNQPTDFDLFVEAQKDFVSDLYDGRAEIVSIGPGVATSFKKTA